MKIVMIMMIAITQKKTAHTTRCAYLRVRQLLAAARLEHSVAERRQQVRALELARVPVHHLKHERGSASASEIGCIALPATAIAAWTWGSDFV